MKACGVRETVHIRVYRPRWLPRDLMVQQGKGFLTYGDVAEAQRDKPLLVLIQLVL